eukprot:Phypoly_transcript_08353.p1 GENE.Phypoly_transcript_08353~~Phypoly_transcript_08353.p1  ORF type:complete len:187 (+),score=20.44 Phypoly_transcript_08353:585-1145(+)
MIECIYFGMCCMSLQSKCVITIFTHFNEYDEESHKTIDAILSVCWRIKATEKSILANPNFLQHLVSLPQVVIQLRKDMIAFPKGSYKFLETICKNLTPSIPPIAILQVDQVISDLMDKDRFKKQITHTPLNTTHKNLCRQIKNVIAIFRYDFEAKQKRAQEKPAQPRITVSHGHLDKTLQGFIRHT